MSRATRPRRSLRLARSLAVIAAVTRAGACVNKASEYARNVLHWNAERLGVRPSVLRRCILGRPVSARAAGRLLAIVGGGV